MSTDIFSKVTRDKVKSAWTPKKVVNTGATFCENCGKDITKFKFVYTLFDSTGCSSKCVVADQEHEMDEAFS